MSAGPKCMDVLAKQLLRAERRLRSTMRMAANLRNTGIPSSVRENCFVLKGQVDALRNLRRKLLAKSGPRCGAR